MFLKGAIDDLNYNEKTWVSDPLAIKLAEYQPAMPAPAKGAVQIAAIRAYGESLNGFVKQYGDVVKAAINSHRIKSRSSSGMAPGC